MNLHGRAQLVRKFLPATTTRPSGCDLLARNVREEEKIVKSETSPPLSQNCESRPRIFAIILYLELTVRLFFFFFQITPILPSHTVR